MSEQYDGMRNRTKTLIIVSIFPPDSADARSKLERMSNQIETKRQDVQDKETKYRDTKEALLRLESKFSGQRAAEEVQKELREQNEVLVKDVAVGQCLWVHGRQDISMLMTHTLTRIQALDAKLHIIGPRLAEAESELKQLRKKNADEEQIAQGYVDRLRQSKLKIQQLAEGIER